MQDISKKKRRSRISFAEAKRKIYRDRALYIMFLPVFIYFVLFKYIPMLGTVIAFKDYKIAYGILGSQWVGLRHFMRLFSSPNFYTILKNTLVLNLLNLIVGFPAPIILSILINEVYHNLYKRTVQTVLYVPHFISWVILGGIVIQLFALEGPVNVVLGKLVPGYSSISFLGQPVSWVVVYVLSGVWQSAGWGTVLYLAAITNVDEQLYEAARLDGAGKFQQVVNVTLPCISGTIVVLLIMRMGQMLNVGFEQIYMLQNKGVLNVSDVISTYEYRVGLEDRQYSYTTALGLFKGLIGFVLVFVTNKIATGLGEEGLW